jgi:hypothetical protein
LAGPVPPPPAPASFCRRILAAADTHAGNFRTALGRVLAHKVGHLVLPDHSHSETGIMNAELDLSSTPQRFSRDEVATIHETIAAALRAKR